MKKGCGKILEIGLGDRDCGAYCPFCKKKHFCINCGGKYRLYKFRKSSDK